jgi:hypothetical protein
LAESSERAHQQHDGQDGIRSRDNTHRYGYGVVHKPSNRNNDDQGKHWDDAQCGSHGLVTWQ